MVKVSKYLCLKCIVYNAQKGLIRALAKSAVCLVNLSANGAKVAGKVPAKDF